MIRTLGLCGMMLALLAGCQHQRYRSMNLGPVGYDAAYQTAVQTLGDYYPIESTHRGEGKIVSRPKVAADTTRRGLAHASARERADMRIRRQRGDVWADIRIVIERQEAASFAYFASMNSQQETPNQTPAMRDAPFTTEQNQIWAPAGANRPMERAILTDLYRRLHPEN